MQAGTPRVPEELFDVDVICFLCHRVNQADTHVSLPIVCMFVETLLFDGKWYNCTMTYLPPSVLSSKNLKLRL